MICDIEFSGVRGVDGVVGRAWPVLAGERMLVAGMLVITPGGELGEVMEMAFGVVGVRLTWGGEGGGRAAVYYPAGDLTPVLCPGDVVSGEEMAGLHGVG